MDIIETFYDNDGNKFHIVLNNGEEIVFSPSEFMELLSSFVALIDQTTNMYFDGQIHKLFMTSYEESYSSLNDLDSKEVSEYIDKWLKSNLKKDIEKGG